MKLNLLFAIGVLMTAVNAKAFTVHSTEDSLGGPGVFYGPGRLADNEIFSIVMRNVSFTSEATFVTPFFNNGGLAPNVAAELVIDGEPDGMFSDGATMINENADVGPFELNGIPFMVGIANGRSHNGEQISVLLDGHIMIMTMDVVFDMGVGEAGIVHVPFYGTTGEAVVPPSLQTQYGIEGGIEQAGSLRAGDRLEGRLGDFDGNGMLDGAIVVAGNLPMTSIFMPGAPYALVRNFETDMPYDGQLIGRLPGDLRLRSETAEMATHAFLVDTACDPPVPCAGTGESGTE